nr:unnamed protein product [Digitaria exilis]
MGSNGYPTWRGASHSHRHLPPRVAPPPRASHPSPPIVTGRGPGPRGRCRGDEMPMIVGGEAHQGWLSSGGVAGEMPDPTLSHPSSLAGAPGQETSTVGREASDCGRGGNKGRPGEEVEPERCRGLWGRRMSRQR